MNYTAEHIDADKFETALRDYQRSQEQQLFMEQAKAQAFYDGYRKALDVVQGMLHCCNYESKEKHTKAFMDGVDSAIYEICKELDVESQDIQDMKTSLDEKAALIAERIKKTLAGADET